MSDDHSCNPAAGEQPSSSIEKSPTSAALKSTSSATANPTVYNPLGSVNPDHPYFALIGRVNAEWAQFEHTLDTIVWELVDRHGSSLTACLTAQFQGAQARLYAIRALIKNKALPERLLVSLKVIEKGIHGPQTARNRIVHDPWFLDLDRSGEAARYKKMAKGEMTLGIEPVNQEHFVATIQEINDLQTRASELRRDVLALLTS